MVDAGRYKEICAELGPAVCLVAVSKTKPVEDIRALYDLGQRDFGENYVQELVDKHPQLPTDIRWHFIGHLQSNKVKYIAPFVHLIHGVDSGKLLKEIGRQAGKAGRTIDALLQVHIAREETKFGLDAEELDGVMRVVGASQGVAAATVEAVAAGTGAAIGQGEPELHHVRVRGLMGMASFVADTQPELVREEFRGLKGLFDRYFPAVNETSRGARSGEPGGDPYRLSMGMSGDYTIALEEGSNMVRIGSLLFGARG